MHPFLLAFFISFFVFFNKLIVNSDTIHGVVSLNWPLGNTFFKFYVMHVNNIHSNKYEIRVHKIKVIRILIELNDNRSMWPYRDKSRENHDENVWLFATF